VSLAMSLKLKLVEASHLPMAYEVRRALEVFNAR
jgi:hypothetical protein